MGAFNKVHWSNAGFTFVFLINQDISVLRKHSITYAEKKSFSKDPIVEILANTVIFDGAK